MEKIRVAVGAAALMAACVGCGGDRIDANGIPLDRVPAGYEAKECHFEDVQSSSAQQEHWQRMVCTHGAS